MSRIKILWFVLFGVKKVPWFGSKSSSSKGLGLLSPTGLFPSPIGFWLAVGSVIHTYETIFHGFSAKLSTSEAQKIESLSGIVAVIHEQVRHVHTTRSSEFLGLKTSDSAGLLKGSDFGSNLVIRVIDTGIWPERKSFNDCELGPGPTKWKGQYVSL
ncbi:Subtilase family protein [Abeliophyllum distichum]|uniref:Subtilase family protein n=1 Tax=Abeliophyllum distichum TaxID=126358 RepID=A0ABD1SAU3_9LAMI